MEEIGKKKILILGSHGMIGHQIFYHLNLTDCFELYNSSFSHSLNRQTILSDLTERSSVELLIKELRPDLVINCSGLLIEDCEFNSKDAILLNAYLPNLLVALCNKFNSKLIQISTDCVFSGKNPPYSENSIKEGESIYSKTKALGEIDTTNHLTIRTSVIGPDLKPNGKELFSWFMRQEKEIEGYNKSIWSGVSSIQLGKSIKEFIDQDISGIYNLTSNESISKYELLVLLNHATKKGLNIRETEGVMTNKTLLDNRSLLSSKTPSYEEMILEMVVFIKSSPSYTHYIL